MMKYFTLSDYELWENGYLFVKENAEIRKRAFILITGVFLVQHYCLIYTVGRFPSRCFQNYSKLFYEVFGATSKLINAVLNVPSYKEFFYLG